MAQQNPETASGFDTLCIHGGHRPDGHRAHLTPIYASSTYTFDNAEQAVAIFEGREEGYIYGRFGNPTIREAEEKIAALEAFRLTDPTGAPLRLSALLHASGMAALQTMLLGTLQAGDKILTHRSLYGGTQETFDKLLPPLGITAIIADFHDHAAVKAALDADERIKILYLETPANPTVQFVDLEALAGIGKAAGRIVCADNTFATPYLQQPFRYGVDYVMHSTTKFLNGHGTAIGGVLVGREDAMGGRVLKTHRLLGGNSNAFDAFLLTNGIKTLGLRMDRHCANTERIAAFLSTHPAIDHVNYLGLPSHPHHRLAALQMKHPGAMLSFELKGGYEAGLRFINGLRLCTSAVSLGTPDTLVSHPASTTHFGVPRDARIASGITDGLIRMSVGLENSEDILADLRGALSATSENAQNPKNAVRPIV